MAELSNSLRWRGYTVIDEDSVRAEIGWPETEDRRSKFELTRNVKEILDHEGVKNRFRIWLLFRINVDPDLREYSTRMTVRFVGEIYDSLTNERLDSYEITKVSTEDANCAWRTRCFDEAVGNVAYELAAEMGEELALKLGVFVPVPTPDATRRCPDCDYDSNDYTLPTPYLISLRRFEQSEVQTIVNVMTDAFPGESVSLKPAESTPTLSRYWYTTTARGHKLQEWFHILLTDMHFNVNTQIRITVDGAEILLEKRVRTPGRRVSPDERRFPL